MAGSQAVWGIDVGKFALKALKLKGGDEGTVEVLAYSYIEHPKILSQSDVDADTAINEALRSFLDKNEIGKDKVVVSVPGQHNLARFSKLPPVDTKKIPDIVKYEAEQQIPFDLDEVIWDYQTFQEEDTPDIEVGIFAMKRELIAQYMLHFESVEIEPTIVQSAPLAIYNAMNFDGWLDTDTAVLIDIGADNTDLIIASKIGLWTRTIPIGGNAFTDALVKAFKLSFSKAENLKRTATTSKYARQIFQAMRPVFADLAQELQRSIGYYTSSHRDARLKQIIGLGNAFKLPGLQKYIQQNLQLDIKQPKRFNKQVISITGKKEDFEEHIPAFSVPYGLALQGLGLATVQNNLLPLEIARQGIWKRKKPYFAAAAGFLLAAGAGIWGRYAIDKAALKANTDGSAVNVSIDQAERILVSGVSGKKDREAAMTWVKVGNTFKEEFNKLSRQGQVEQQEIDDVIFQQANRQLLPHILQVIHSGIPQGPPAMAAALTPEEYVEAALHVPRKQRNEVFIERFRMNFMLDVNTELIEDAFFTEDTNVVAATVKQGFIFTLYCRTPRTDDTAGFRPEIFIHQELINPLRKVGREPGLGFFINRIGFSSGQALAAPAALQPGRAPIRGRGAPPGQFPPPGPAQPAAKAQFVDVLTNEPYDEDWIFTLKFDVVLEDFAPYMPEPAEGEPTGEEPPTS